MKERRPWWKIVAVVCAALVVIVAIGVLVRLSTPSLRVKVLDPKVRVFSASVVRERGNKLYLGNQMEGFARDFLKNKLHLNVTQLHTSIRSLRPGDQSHSFLMIHFSVEADPSSTSPFSPEKVLDAELEDYNGNIVIPNSVRLNNFGSRVYWQAFDLDTSRTNAGNYRIRLVRERIRVAEVEIYGLPAVVRKPYHVGPNAF